MHFLIYFTQCYNGFFFLTKSLGSAWTAYRLKEQRKQALLSKKYVDWLNNAKETVSANVHCDVYLALATLITNQFQLLTKNAD